MLSTSLRRYVMAAARRRATRASAIEQRSSTQVELLEESLRPELGVVAAHGLDKVAALPAAELELEALPLRVLEHVLELRLWYLVIIEWPAGGREPQGEHGLAMEPTGP